MMIQVIRSQTRSCASSIHLEVGGGEGAQRLYKNGNHVESIKQISIMVSELQPYSQDIKAYDKR